LWFHEKSFLKKGNKDKKPWIKGSGICTGKSSVENKLTKHYYSNFSGIYDLQKKLKNMVLLYQKLK